MFWVHNIIDMDVCWNVVIFCSVIYEVQQLGHA